MLRRDYILNEANKLAKLIAKLMGLQTEGNGDEFRANFDEALQEEYDLELAELTDMPEAEFSQRIKNADYSQEKLNALSQMLYMSAEPFEPTEQTASLLRKVMIIFDELEATHHFESFENLNKRSHIYTFFKRTMKDLKWKTLSTTYVHKGPWATLRADKCEMPDGTIVDEYYVLEYPNWANAVALTENNKIIMIRQYRHAAGIVSLEIPGGVIEEGEDKEAGMRRELLEETGYEFTDVELISTVYANPSTAGNVTYCYLARGGKKVQGQTLDEHEQIEVMEYTIDEVKQLLADNKIPQSLHCTGLFYALMRLGELK